MVILQINAGAHSISGNDAVTLKSCLNPGSLSGKSFVEGTTIVVAEAIIWIYITQTTVKVKIEFVINESQNKYAVHCT